jgi:hypothetical protein
VTDIYYDPYDFEIDSDPYPVWQRLRDEQPLYYNEGGDGFVFASELKGLMTCGQVPTALDAGWYSSKGFRVRRHRQYVRATGFPPPSTCASAASNSGVMTAVACSRKSDPYSFHVSAGLLSSEWAKGNKISVGLE